MVYAKICCTGLELRHDTCSQGPWITPHKADQCFGELQTLRLQPRAFAFTPDGEYSRPDTLGNTSSGNAADVLNTTLQSMASRLQQLVVDGEQCPMSFPPAEFSEPTFLELRHLELSNISIEPDPFSDWLDCCPNLEYLKLRNPTLTESFIQWRQILRTVRNHPSKMLVVVEDLDLDFNEIHLNFKQHTADRLDEYQGSNTKKRIEYSLRGYLTGVGEWDDILEACFSDM